MNEKQMELIEEVVRLMSERALDSARRNADQRAAYFSALAMLKYALAEDACGLAQFDY